MNNAYTDKASAEKEKMDGELAMLKAKLKIAAADTRITIENKINEIEAKLKTMMRNDDAS